jgi:hypothetical protein
MEYLGWVTEEGKDRALAGWEEKVSLSKMVLELEMSALLRSIKADSILPGSLPFMYIFPSGPISDHARELTTGQEQPWHKGPGLSLCSSRNSTLPRSHLMAGLTVRRVCRSKCQSKRGVSKSIVLDLAKMIPIKLFKDRTTRPPEET